MPLPGWLPTGPVEAAAIKKDTGRTRAERLPVAMPGGNVPDDGSADKFLKKEG